MSLKLKALKHIYANIAARNAILAGNRVEGMTVTVLNNGLGAVQNYRLEGGILNANWESSITDKEVLLAMMADMATNSFIGRASVGAGSPEVLSKAQALSVLNVEDGATADQIASEVPNTPSGNLVSNNVQDALNEIQSELDSISAVVAGGAIFKGDYDASTDSPILDGGGGTIISTSVGDMYIVTVAGTFFTIPVEIGDVLIAKQVNATLETHWSIVQANLTSASIKTQYESNADTNAFTDAEKTVVGNTSGTNTGDNAVNSLYSGLVSNATHSGDATGATALTLATVNSNVGSFTNANITVNAKGLVTAASNGSGVVGGRTTITGTQVTTDDTIDVQIAGSEIVIPQRSFFAIEVECIAHNGSAISGGIDITAYKTRKFNGTWRRSDTTTAIVAGTDELYHTLESHSGMDVKFNDDGAGSLFLYVTGVAATIITWSYVISYYSILEQ